MESSPRHSDDVENPDDDRSQRSNPLVGRILVDRYEVVAIASIGANTVICDAIDRTNDRPVTLKIVRPEHAVGEEFGFKFDRLGELTHALTHPNVAAVLDWGEIEIEGDETVYWTVEALGGGSLRDLLDRGRLLEPSQALVVGLEACRALDAAHQVGLFHTELTPSKLVFGSDRRLRVVDFGMARLLAERSWQDPPSLPTHVARYASPEQATGSAIDARTDIYALSLMLIEAVTGDLPFDGDSTVSTLAARVDRLMPVSADLGSLASVLERAGRPEPGDRFSAAEFGRALVDAAQSLPKPEPVPIVGVGLFDTTDMRRPDDPTGGIARPSGDPEEEPESDDGHGAAAAAAAGVVAAGAAAGAGMGSADVAAATTGDGVGDGAADPDAPGVGEEPNGVAGIAAASDGLPLTEPVDVVADDDPASSVDDDGDPSVVAPGVSSQSGADDPVGDALPPTEPIELTGDDPVGDALPPTEPIDAVPAAGAGARTGAATDSGADAAGADDGEAAGTAAVVLAGGTAAGDGDGDADAEADDPPWEGEDRDPDADLHLVDPAPVPGVGPHGTEPMPATVVAAAPTAVVDELAPSMSGPTLFDDDLGGDPTGEVFDGRPDRRRRTGSIIALVLVFLLGLGALAYAGSLLLRTKSFDVPTLAGTNVDEARNLVAGNEWVIDEIRERSDEFPEIDTVIRTDPEPGVEIEEGGDFTMVVSDGYEFRTLPDVAGLPVGEAVAELEGLLLVGREASERVFSETVEPGVVDSWVVDGDATLTEGAQVLPLETTVVLTVSMGPEPRTVPDLVGRSGDEATAALDDLRLTPSRADDVFSNDVPAGQIVSQDPPPGGELARGGTVTFTVSKGPDVVDVPDIVDLTYGEAVARLEEAGFTVGDVLGTTDGVILQATIDGEPIEPGTQFRRGQPVDLVAL